MIELDLNTALVAAKAARHKARELEITVSVAIVDESGRTICIQRGDGLGFVTTDFALAKAVAAAGFKRETNLIKDKWDELNAFMNSALHAASSPIVIGTGAVPIYDGERIIGAIGCGGAAPEMDRECALAGAEAVKTLLEESG